jgi:hypothetical protein
MLLEISSLRRCVPAVPGRKLIRYHICREAALHDSITGHQEFRYLLQELGLEKPYQPNHGPSDYGHETLPTDLTQIDLLPVRKHIAGQTRCQGN